MSIQDEFDQLKPGQTLTLNPPRGEFKGPLVIRKAVLIEGQGGTIWSAKGPVLTIASAGVTLRDLNVEITGREALEGDGACALKVEPGVAVALENVAVRGNVSGLAREEGNWRCPRSLALGTIKAGVPHEFKVVMNVPVACTIEPEIDGLQVLPKQVQGSPVSVLLKLDPLPTGTRLRGQVKLKTGSLTRRISLTGNVSDGAAVLGNGQVLWQPDDMGQGRPPEPEATVPIVEPSGPRPPETPATQPIKTRPTHVAPPEALPGSTPVTMPTQVPVVSTPAEGSSTLVVSQFDTAQFRTIGEALQRARTGGRILVRPGTYKESLVLDRKVEIIGDGPAADIVIESPDSNCVKMQADMARVRNLTLRGAAGRSSRERYAVLIQHGQLILEDCRITSDSLACVAVQGSTTSPIIRRCKIFGGKSAGVLVCDRGEAVFEDCDIFENALSGVEVRAGGNPVLRNCRVYGGHHAGVLVHDSGKATLEDCEIHTNKLSNVEIRTGGNPTLRRCKLFGGQYPGVRVHDNGLGQLEDCDIYDNALAGVEIKQANPTLRRCKVREGKQAGVLCGRNAQGTLEDCEVFGNGLAGVEIRQGGNPTLKRCVIRENGDAGVLVRDKGKGILEDCEIHETGQSAVEVRQGSTPTLRRCKVHDSKQAGVALAGKSAAVLEECEITSNKGAGVLIQGGSNPTLKRCKVQANTLAGVVVAAESRGTLERCELAENGMPGLMIFQEANPTVRSCKIVRNKDVGVEADTRAAGSIEDCDLTNNRDGPLEMGKESQVKLVKNKVDLA
jgi:F-box protein 11